MESRWNKESKVVTGYFRFLVGDLRGMGRIFWRAKKPKRAEVFGQEVKKILVVILLLFQLHSNGGLRVLDQCFF